MNRGGRLKEPTDTGVPAEMSLTLRGLYNLERQNDGVKVIKSSVNHECDSNRSVGSTVRLYINATASREPSCWL